MLFVAAASRGVIGFAVKSPANDESLPGADTLRYLPQIGYTVSGTGGLLAAALTIATTSLLIVKTAVFARWLAWIGIVVALLIAVAAALLSAVFAIPAVLIWATAASAAMWRAPRSPREADTLETVTSGLGDLLAVCERRHPHPRTGKRA